MAVGDGPMLKASPLGRSVLTSEGVSLSVLTSREAAC